MKTLEKKGVSPVIASVLLILLVIVLASIIFAFALKFMDDKTEDAQSLSMESCKTIDFTAMVVSTDEQVQDLEIVNRGNIDIGAFEFKVYYNDGNSVVVDSDLSVSAGESVTGSVDFDGALIDGIDKIEVFPVLRATSSRPIVCRDDPVYL